MKDTFLKLLYSTVGVLTTSTVLNYLYVKYLVDEPFLSLKLNFMTDEGWAEDCKEYILDYLPDWANDSFTQRISKCTPVCSPSGKGSKYNIHYDDPECRTYPLMFTDGETTEDRLQLMPYGEATIPCFLNISPSIIPGANRGIFTKVKLSKGFMFGPYTGVIRSAYGDEGEEAKNGGYAWRINRLNDNDEEDDIYIDGVNETNSNWLRYVNSARWEEEQNLYVLMFNDTVYYITYKDVEPGTELLVWYGKSYAEYLTIEVADGAVHDWESDFAPKKDIVICDSCPVSRPPESNDNSTESEVEGSTEEEDVNEASSDDGEVSKTKAQKPDEVTYEYDEEDEANNIINDKSHVESAANGDLDDDLKTKPHPEL